VKEPVIAYSSWSYATLVTSISSQHLSEWLKQRGFSPIEIVGSSANRLRFKRVMNYIQKDKPKPALISYQGHGFPNSLVGFEPVAMKHESLRMVTKTNDQLLKDCIVHTVACYTVRELGPDIIAKGGAAYFGSTVPMLVGDFEKDRAYLPDFVDVFTTVPKALCMGKTTGEAFEDYRACCERHINFYNEHDELKNVDFYKDAMIQNKDKYELLGNRNARYNPGV
jgi:hypothetical protein